MVVPLELEGAKPKNKQQFGQNRIFIGTCLWLVACFFYFRLSYTRDVQTLQSSSSSTKGGLRQQASPVDFSPMLEFMNASAGEIYSDHFPDCLYILQQTVDPATNRTRYVLKQSMNDYWKHVVGFRRIQLKFNLGILVDMVETLNMDAPLVAHLAENILDPKTPRRYQHELLHQRIFEAGGSFPFYAHWKVLHPDPQICDDTHHFPIFRRALPTLCSSDFNHWLIPTAPIIRQIKKINWPYKMQHMVPRARQQRVVAVATTAGEISVPNEELDSLKMKGQGSLSGKLHCEYYFERSVLLVTFNSHHELRPCSCGSTEGHG